MTRCVLYISCQSRAPGERRKKREMRDAGDSQAVWRCPKSMDIRVGMGCHSQTSGEKRSHPPPPPHRARAVQRTAPSSLQNRPGSSVSPPDRRQGSFQPPGPRGGAAGRTAPGLAAPTRWIAELLQTGEGAQKKTAPWMRGGQPSSHAPLYYAAAAVVHRPRKNRKSWHPRGGEGAHPLRRLCWSRLLNLMQLPPRDRASRHRSSTPRTKHRA
jgi:hypothetical protein